MQEARIVLVQDRPESLDYQEQQFRKEADRRGLPLQIERFDLRQPSHRLSRRLAEAGMWFDWMVTDLLWDGVDHEPLQSKGMRLLREVVAGGHFRRYGPRTSRPTGIRCIAVCSVCVDHGSVLAPGLEQALTELGVRLDWCARGGDVRDLCPRVLDEVQAQLRLDATGS